MASLKSKSLLAALPNAWLWLGLVGSSALCLSTPWVGAEVEKVLTMVIAYCLVIVWSKGRFESGIGVCLVFTGSQPFGCPRVTGALVFLCAACHVLTGPAPKAVEQLRLQRMIASLLAVYAGFRLPDGSAQMALPLVLYAAVSLTCSGLTGWTRAVKIEAARSGISDIIWIVFLAIIASLETPVFLLGVLLWMIFEGLRSASDRGDLSEAFVTQMGVAEQTLRESEKRRLKERDLIKELASAQLELDRFQGAALKAESLERVGKCLIDSLRNLKRGVTAGLVRIKRATPELVCSAGDLELEKFLPFPDGPGFRRTLKSPDGYRLLGSLGSELYVCIDYSVNELDDLGRGIVQNLLERAYLISEIVEQQSRLAQLVSEKTGALEELARSQKQLIQSGKMAAVGQLAAGVAHEINSPLAAILVQTQLATRRLNKGDLSGVGRSLETSLSASSRAKAIIDNLLTFSRLSDGSRVKVALAEAVRSSLDMIESHHFAQRVEIISKVPTDIIVEANLQDLQHIITNICLNALDALGELNQESRVLAIEARDIASGTSLEIKNNGPTIPEDVVERLFEPFFTTKGIGEGTGLGLSIAYELSRNLGIKLSLKQDETWVCFLLEF